MREPLTYDRIEELEAFAGTPETHRNAAATLLGWSAESHPDDGVDVGPAQLLAAAGWHLAQAGDTEESLALYRRAVADGGACLIDARVQLAGALMDADFENEARQVNAGFRRSSPALADLALMAEVFEAAGDLREAHRLVNIGVTRLDLDEIGDPTPVEAFGIEQLLSTRRRIRHALGHPPDELDLAEG